MSTAIEIPTSFDEIRQYKMPFGKYRRKKIEEIPVDYLVWCTKPESGFSNEFKAAIETYLNDPSVSAEVELVRSRSKIVGRPKKADPLVFTFSLPGDNQIDIRLKRKLITGEAAIVRKVIDLIQEVILETIEDSNGT